MRRECLDLLAPVSGEVYCDATVGLGGHAEAILEASGPSGRLIGIDRDPDALDRAAARLSRFGDRVTLVRGEFGELPALLADVLDGVDGLLVDLGVSSLQLDDAARGFSFGREGPLDMRMGQAAGMEQTARDWLLAVDERELATRLREWADQRGAGRVAAAIKRYVTRAADPTTTGLAAAIAAAAPARRGRTPIHPATQAFMAIRIAVNDELGQLQRLLADFPRVLARGARVVIIAFHSLEDRLVKRRFRELTRAGGDLPADLPLTDAQRPAAPFELLTRRALKPTTAESEANPRARSARVRAVRYQGAAA